MEQLKSALTDVSSRLETVARAAPQVEKAIAELKARLQRVLVAPATNRAEMEAVRKASDRVQNIRDEAAKRALILGRVSLYLESLLDLPDTKKLAELAEQLRAQCGALEDELSDERIKDRLASIASILGRRMTDWARDLDLEHSEDPLRLDIKKLTIVADTADGPVPMDRVGSGTHWVGYRLIGHLALHEWFTQRGRTVSRFLFSGSAVPRLLSTREGRGRVYGADRRRRSARCVANVPLRLQNRREPHAGLPGDHHRARRYQLGLVPGSRSGTLAWPRVSPRRLAARGRRQVT